MALQGGFDRWFGTISRYTGLVLLLYAAIVDRLQNPALLPVAAGLIGLKSVTGAGK